MKYLFLILLVACSNKAITYAEALDPSADCSSIRNSWTGREADIAVCRVIGEVWRCEVGDHVVKCDVVKTVSAEAPKK